VQAFSYLQRNIADKNYIKLSFVSAFFVLYLMLSTLNPYLPPLFGVLIVAAHMVRKKEFMWFALLYLIIFEMDRGYYLFSSWLFMFFYIYYLIPFVSNFLDCKRCIAALAAFCAYPLYYVFLNMIDGFFLKETISVSFAPLIIYMFFETLLALSLE
jgi:hypothetical protein